mmetsp:Transcript_15433/g.23738  ORF Transcript_15433/g.23738 Transcript_15433/m.23738 type:complete len:92 (+) Transcript_15433:9-284(+)
MAEWQDKLKRFEFSKDTNSLKPIPQGVFQPAVKAVDHRNHPLNNSLRHLSTERERPMMIQASSLTRQPETVNRLHSFNSKVLTRVHTPKGK